MNAFTMDAPQRTCHYCDKDVTTRRKNARYCSPSCRVRDANARKKAGMVIVEKQTLLNLIHELLYLAGKAQALEVHYRGGSGNQVAESYLNLKRDQDEDQFIKAVLNQAKHG